MSTVRRAREWLVPTVAAAAFVIIGVGFVALLESREATIETLVITTVPSGAMITLDGRMLGPAPVRVDNVSVGKHAINVVKEGFVALDDTVVVDEEIDEPLSFELHAVPPRGAAGTPAEGHAIEYARLAEAAFDDGHLVSPYSGSALYYADALQSVDRASPLPDELRQRIRLALLAQARDLTPHDPKSASAIYDQLLRAFPNDADVRAAIADEEEANAPTAANVTHLHTRGSCTGTLAITRTNVRFRSSRRDHTFSFPVRGIRLERQGDVLILRSGGRQQRLRCVSRDVARRLVRAFERARE